MKNSKLFITAISSVRPVEKASKPIKKINIAELVDSTAEAVFETYKCDQKNCRIKETKTETNSNHTIKTCIREELSAISDTPIHNEIDVSSYFSKLKNKDLLKQTGAILKLCNRLNEKIQNSTMSATAKEKIQEIASTLEPIAKKAEELEELFKSKPLNLIMSFDRKCGNGTIERVKCKI